jgi:hypothetical protein
MIKRVASVLVCDDVLFGITGKAYLNGVYTGDITIPGDELTINQLVFYFTVETPKQKPIHFATLRVTPPGTTPTELHVPLLPAQASVNPARPQIIIRAPLVVQQLVLKPGKIETVVIADGDELDAGGIWIITVPKTA